MALVAAIYGFTGVILGALGAHALQSCLTEAQLHAWDTAVLYQLVHALALLALSIWYRQQPDRQLRLAGGGFAVGVALFSGSIYLLALGGPSWLGPVTPVGGVAMIFGWGVLVYRAIRA